MSLCLNLATKLAVQNNLPFQAFVSVRNKLASHVLSGFIPFRERKTPSSPIYINIIKNLRYFHRCPADCYFLVKFESRETSFKIFS